MKGEFFMKIIFPVLDAVAPNITANYSPKDVAIVSPAMVWTIIGIVAIAIVGLTVFFIKKNKKD